MKAMSIVEKIGKKSPTLIKNNLKTGKRKKLGNGLKYYC